MLFSGLVSLGLANYLDTPMGGLFSSLQPGSFIFYHLHEPWMLPNIIVSSLAITWPARRFRSNWMSIIVYGAEGVQVVVLALAVILGLMTP
jgi:hypothetical protein